MMWTTHTLRITVPDSSDMDDETLAQIRDGADTQDRDWSAKVLRYLGAVLCEAEADISAGLPEGWSARIEGGEARV